MATETVLFPSASNKEHEACFTGMISEMDPDAPLSNGIVLDTLNMAEQTAHLGGVIPDQTGDGKGIGDGCGVVMGMPVNIFQKWIDENKKTVPQVKLERYKFGAGTYFLPKDPSVTIDGKSIEDFIADKIKTDNRFNFIGWRDIPINTAGLADKAIEKMPRMKDIVFTFNEDSGFTPEEYEKACMEMQIEIDTALEKFNEDKKGAANRITCCALSSEKLIRKGMLRTGQLRTFFKEEFDIAETDWVAFHNRFSTNVDPDWDRPHPYTFVAVNGEFNTDKANRGERLLIAQALYNGFGINAKTLADSGHFGADVMENMLRRNKKLSEAIVSLMPPNYENDSTMSPQVKAMLFYNAMMREPYTGPTHAVFFSKDERGSALDPSGLRPARLLITTDETGKVKRYYLCSEQAQGMEALAARGEYAGETDILDEGQMFLWRKGKRMDGREVMEEMADPARNGGVDYVAKLKELLVSEQFNGHADLSSLKPDPHILPLLSRQVMCLWEHESEKTLFEPMVATGKMPTSAMGADEEMDSAWSKLPSHIAHLFKKMFAQVTNPALDALRERESFSLTTSLGPNALMSSVKPESFQHGAKIFKLDSPFLRPGQLEQVKKAMPAAAIDITFERGANAAESIKNYKERIKQICEEAEHLAREGQTVLILSDRNIGADRATLADVDAVAAVQAHLEKKNLRLRTSIIAETGQAHEPHHAAVLAAVGANAIDTYLAHEKILDLFATKSKTVEGMTQEQAFKNYYKAMEDSMLKIMASMGISNFINYSGSKLLEIVGLDNSKDELAERYGGYYSPIGGLNENSIAMTQVLGHHLAVQMTKCFAELKPIMLDMLEELGVPGAREKFSGDQLLPLFMDRYGKLEEAAQLKESDRARKLGDVLIGIAGQAAPELFEPLRPKSPEIGVAITAEELAEEARKRKLREELYEKARSIAGQRAREISQAVEMARPSQDEKDNMALLDHGRFSMHQDGKKHIFGPEYVNAITEKYYKKLEAKREKHIAAEMKKYRAEVAEIWASDEDKEKLLREKEEYLRKYAHFPRDKDNRIDREFLKNYGGPSEEFTDFMNEVEKFRQDHPIVLRDRVKLTPANVAEKIADAVVNAIAKVTEVVFGEEAADTVLDVLGRGRSGAMSLGALTKGAHETIHEAEYNIWAGGNAGEGGSELKNLGTKLGARDHQIASGRFGVTPEMLRVAALTGGRIQIKIVQGAKPGEGGELPPGKVYVEIAGLRQATPGVGLPSPAPMHDIYSIEDLPSLINSIKSFGPPVDVKIGTGENTATVAVGCAKGGADTITVAGPEGGTGAAPANSARNTGTPWEVELIRTHAELIKSGLRGNTQLVVEGGIATVHDAVMALYLGADVFGTGTLEMIANKCIMARVCYAAGISKKEYDDYNEKLNAKTGQRLEDLPHEEAMELVKQRFCPTGVTNSGEALFRAEPWRIEQFKIDFAASVRQRVKDLGFDSIKEFQNAPVEAIFEQPKEFMNGKFGEYKTDFLDLKKQTIGKGGYDEKAPKKPRGDRADDRCMEAVKEHLLRCKKEGKVTQYEVDLGTLRTDNSRSVGAALSGLVCEHVYDGRENNKMDFWPDRMAAGRDAALKVKMKGNIGRQAGFALAHGMHLDIEGEAMDGLGSSGNGGVISVRELRHPNNPNLNKLDRKLPVLAGNAVAYGNQGTDIYIAGRVGQRAGICMKGGALVIEGAGAYMGEFMSGGTLINLGKMGRSIGNGATGGVIIQYDPNKEFGRKIDSSSMRQVQGPEVEEYLEKVVKPYLQEHLKHTNSSLAQKILLNWETEKNKFSIGVPKSYDKFKSADELSILQEASNLYKHELSLGQQLVFDLLGRKLLGRIIDKAKESLASIFFNDDDKKKAQEKVREGMAHGQIAQEDARKEFLWETEHGEAHKNAAARAKEWMQENIASKAKKGGETSLRSRQI